MLRERRGLCSLLSSPFYAVITHLITDYTYITLCLFSLIHFIAHINFYHRSIHSIHLKISPDPLLRALPHLRALCLFPRPPGVGGAGGDDAGVASVDDWSGRECGIHSAHSPLGSFTTR